MPHHAFNPARQALRRYIPMPLLIRSAPLEGMIAREKILADFVQDIGMEVSIGHVPRISPGTRPGHQERRGRARRRWTAYGKSGVEGAIACPERRSRYCRRIRIS